MRHLLTIIFILWICGLTAQESIPKISFADFLDETPALAQDANAVVLKEFGKTQLEVIEADHALRVVHDYFVRIKILKKEGVEEANFAIPLYAYGSDFESITEIKGKTYNIKNNSIQETEMTNKAFFTDKVRSHVHVAKFTLPQVEEGSIIDVQFRLTSPDVLNFRTWEFQRDIPKLHSEYTAIMPASYQYRVTLRGPYQLTDTKSEILRSYFLLNGVRNDCSKITYIMDNVPSFQEEDYMLAPKNYKSAVFFELEQYYLTNGSKVKVTKEWRDVDRELLTEKYFGGQIKKNDVFENILPILLAGKTTTTDRAKAIYYYIQQNIKWNDYYGKYAQYGVKESLEKHSGNIGDINLALIAALNTASINTYPVLVSTRDNGIPNNLHPVISDFNYVIAAAEIDGKTVLLDASDRFTPFAELPLRCINEKGRIIYSKKSSEWIPLTNQESSILSFTFLGELDSTATLKGRLSITYKGLDALRKRSEIASFSSHEEYFESVEAKRPSIRMNNPLLRNVDSLEDFLIEEFDMEIDMGNEVQNGLIHFNPILIERTSKNPFNLNERLYQVDLGSKRQITHTTNIALPKNYKVTSSPKNVSLKLPEEAARFSAQSLQDQDRLVTKQTIALNKPIYSVDEYFHLKEFYSRIIQQQEIDFTLEKID
ncbi:DUF3857 domain-containing protein [Sphingobacterium sp. LRF_L2]|uniref:DUF3857 domain-containing protein n=1 Tax=Sphingobacterium sp. LRF_L2 TaxID=3369421 RepID=UPI003F63EA39